MGSHLEETYKRSCVNNYFELFGVIILVITTLIFFCESVFWRYILLMSTARANDSLFKSESAPFSQKS